MKNFTRNSSAILSLFQKDKSFTPFLKKAIIHFLIFVLILSTTLSASYQQQRFFSLKRPLGIKDTYSYVQMAKGNYDVSPTHNKRFVIPSLVKLVRPFILPIHNKYSEKLSVSTMSPSKKTLIIVISFLLADQFCNYFRLRLFVISMLLST